MCRRWPGSPQRCSGRGKPKTSAAGACGRRRPVVRRVGPSHQSAGVLPVGIALGIGIRRWLLLIAGGLPGAVFLGIVNATGLWARPHHRLWRRRRAFLGQQRSGDAPPLCHLAARVIYHRLVVLSLGLPVLRRSQPLVSALLWHLGLLVFLGCYLLYCFTHETWWYLRFILPAVPPLLVAALLVARALAGRWRLAVRASLVGVGDLRAIHRPAASGSGISTWPVWIPVNGTYIESALWLESHAASQCRGGFDADQRRDFFTNTEFPIVLLGRPFFRPIRICCGSPVQRPAGQSTPHCTGLKIEEEGGVSPASDGSLDPDREDPRCRHLALRSLVSAGAAAL